MTQAKRRAKSKPADERDIKIGQLEAELDEMTAALSQAWDQLVPFLQASPPSTDTSAEFAPLLESIMTAVDAPMGAVYLAPRDSRPEEWFTAPTGMFSLNALKAQLGLLTDVGGLLRMRGAHPWTGALTSWVFTPLVVDNSIVGAIGVGSESVHREFTNSDTRLLRRMAERATGQIVAVRLAESRAREAQLAHELQIAGMIQRSILPTTFPQLPGVHLAAEWIPASNVGGDAWGWSVQPSGKLACYVLDVAGKGLPASLGAVSLRSVLKALLRLDFSPGEAVRAVSEEFYDSYTEAGILSTLNVFTLDPITGEFVQANAGHTPTLVRRGDEQWTRLPATAPPIGVWEDTSPLEQRLTLQAGDVVLCYSDGLSEISTASGMWGEEGIRSAIHMLDVEPADVVRSVLECADAVRENKLPHDDQTILCVTYAGLN